MTLIKICGLTSVDDALEVALLDVQMIGLVFAPSRRQVTQDKAAEICAAVRKRPHHPLIAGVFANEEAQAVNKAARQCGLDVVQLSGDESPEYCKKIEAPVIKAVHIEDSASARDIIGRLAAGQRDVIFLLDSKKEGMYGGTGRNFSRDIARDVSAALPVIIAGGLDPINVAGLIEYARPAGVDVSSGVETSGQKDMDKIRSFIKAVRSAERPGSDNNPNLLYKYILKVS